MLVMFIGALVQAAIRGLDISCGCFGGTSGYGRVGVLSAIGRDVFLLTSVLFMVFSRRHHHQS